MAASGEVKITRCKVTKHGLLTLFSDGHVYLFHNSFLIENRLQHADRIVDGRAVEALLVEARHPVVGNGVAKRTDLIGTS